MGPFSTLFEFVRLTRALHGERGSREAGENPARPPPLSPGTPRATNHWTRCDRDTGRASGKEPGGGRSGSQETCRTTRFPVGAPERDAPPNSRGRGIFSTSRDLRLVEREVRMTTAVLLVLLGALSRLFLIRPTRSPGRPRALRRRPPAAALGLGGARSPPWRCPTSSSISGRAAPRSASRASTIYATFAAIVLIGRAAAREGPRRRARSRFPSGLRALLPDEQLRGVGRRSGSTRRLPRGSLLCFAAAIPFFWNTLAADLAGTAVLFGLDALARLRAPRAAARSCAGVPPPRSLRSSPPARPRFAGSRRRRSPSPSS